MPVKYRTIVADPPWDHSDGTGFSFGVQHLAGNRLGSPRKTQPSYPALSVEEITQIPVTDLSEMDAHLYLWTTQRYLHQSFHVVESWGFSVSSTLVWCKAPLGFMGADFRSSTEFIQFARRGHIPRKTQAPSQWFTWPRRGWTQADPAGKHSQKPDAFLDLVETVSPGPYLELFARRQRLGWDTWGNEALEHVSLSVESS